MQTTNVVDENIKRIGELFPNCLTERLNDEGKPEIAMRFCNQLRQELSKDIVDGNEERYQFTWPDKRNAGFDWLTLLLQTPYVLSVTMKRHLQELIAVTIL